MVIYNGDLKVTKQVEVEFSIGKYHDKVLYDLVPMQAYHILLGHPWQYDKKVMYDGLKNKYSFSWNGHKISLAPLTLFEVHEDQVWILKDSKERKKLSIREKEKSVQKEGCVQEKRDKNKRVRDRESEKISVLIVSPQLLVPLY